MFLLNREHSIVELDKEVKSDISLKENSFDELGTGCQIPVWGRIVPEQ